MSKVAAERRLGCANIYTLCGSDEEERPSANAKLMKSIFINFWTLSSFASVSSVQLATCNHLLSGKYTDNDREGKSWDLYLSLEIFVSC